MNHRNHFIAAVAVLLSALAMFATAKPADVAVTTPSCPTGMYCIPTGETVKPHKPHPKRKACVVANNRPAFCRTGR